MAVDAGLAHELGDAGTLLALIASWTGRWHEVFRQEFIASLHQPRELSLATYDANLCFAEFHVAGALPGPDTGGYARELLALAEDARSVIGQGMAPLMIGEAHLPAGEYDLAHVRLQQARRTNREAGAACGLCITLERLAQTETALGRLEPARELLDEARIVADASPLRSHLQVRLFGVAIRAASDQDAMATVTAAERALADASRGLRTMLRGLPGPGGEHLRTWRGPGPRPPAPLGRRAHRRAVAQRFLDRCRVGGPCGVTRGPAAAPTRTGAALRSQSQLSRARSEPRASPAVRRPPATYRGPPAVP
jgi:hypothetical protein